MYTKTAVMLLASVFGPLLAWQPAFAQDDQPLSLENTDGKQLVSGLGSALELPCALVSRVA